MALYVLKYDLPPNTHRAQYAAGVPDRIQSSMRQPGLVEFRGYRNPKMDSPNVMVHIEFESLRALRDYLDTEDYAASMTSMIEEGCRSIQEEIWGASPFLPEPLKPERLG